MRDETSSIDPRRFASETFDLYSIPAFDGGVPEVVLGRDIGSAKQNVEPNDVLLSRIVPHIRRAWVVGPKNGHRQIGSGEWIVFRSSEADPRYLRHVLVSDPFYERFMMTVAGVGGSLLRARPKHVAEIEIPLPSIEEQRRIAAILDQADALRAKRRAALAQLDEMPNAIFMEMFGDPTSNPKRLECKPLGDLASLTSGGTPSKTREEFWGPGLPWVSPKDMKSLRIADAIDHVTPLALESGGLKLIPAGATLIVVRGMILAHTAPVSITDTDVTINQDMKAIAFGEDVLPEFGFWCLKVQQGDILDDVDEASHGTKRLDTARLLRRQILVPALELQQAFVAQIASWQAIIEAARNQLSVADSLFTSLQHRAFRGEL